MADETQTATALMHAERVRARLEAYGRKPLVPQISEEACRVHAPHVIELCRDVVQQWYEGSGTPQLLSLAVIRLRDELIEIAMQEARS
jgi:hypothetical protein